MLGDSERIVAHTEVCQEFDPKEVVSVLAVIQAESQN